MRAASAQTNQFIAPNQQYDDGQYDQIGDYAEYRPDDLPMPSRLGGRNLSHEDQLYAQDFLESRLQEEAVPPGPKCFARRILIEPKPEGGFQMPRGLRTFDGSTNPDDWLTDYAHAVHMANGNLRWAI
jgi:hypothetical protein